MPRITEQKLSFIFPDTWQAIKYYDESFYNKNTLPKKLGWEVIG